MRVAFFHGHGSKPYTERNPIMDRLFDHVWCPDMDYTSDSLFVNTLEKVLDGNYDLLIGSSMGAWFAYCISTHTGIPTLLFNPAVHSRPIDPYYEIGNKKGKHLVILGREDKVIEPNQTVDWFSENGIGSFRYEFEDMAHRIPTDVFAKWAIESKKLNEVLSFSNWNMIFENLSDEWLNISLTNIEEKTIKSIWNMYTYSYGKENLDLSANDIRELKQKYTGVLLLKDFNGKEVAFFIYRTTEFGNKLALLGTNGDNGVAKKLLHKLLELMNTKGWFLEASNKIEAILKNSNSPVIKDKHKILSIVGDHKSPTMLSDGYYTRKLSKIDKTITKRLYGII